ncbi:MAG: hypothetical protein C0402_11135 [Thermodesulfovibrio sp.]|nr:hypothetical protein [Thermodesulfovibrio sp.]
MSEKFTILERDTPWRGQVCTTYILGGLLTLLGGFFIYMTLTHTHQEPLSESWGVLVIGGVFGLVGLILDYVAIHQSFASRVPESEVALDTLPVRRGETVRLRVIQPGPVRLTSITANLLCKITERRKKVATKSGENPYYYEITYPYQQRVPVCGPAAVAAGGRIEHIVEFMLPKDALPTGGDDARRITWHIELWGCVVRWPDFMHPYTITVSISGQSGASLAQAGKFTLITNDT